MDIDISAKHVVVEESIKEKARSLIARLAEDFPNQKITTVRVLFAAQRNWFPVEILVNAKNLTLHAAARNDSMGASLVNAFAKINTQMERYLEKVRDSSVKADPAAKDKMWNSKDLRAENDDADLEDYTYEIEEK